MRTEFVASIVRLVAVLFLCLATFPTVSCTGFSPAALKSGSSPDGIRNSRQMILVTTEGWQNVDGILQRFERSDSPIKWRMVGSPIPVVVGRNGLGWGKGLHKEIDSPLQKKEGDGKSPAGIFRLSSTFGFVSPGEMTSLKLPYTQLTDSLECVDDVQSSRYNSIVDREQIPNADWKSSEKMLAIGEQYRLGVVVDHNAAPRNPGGGSCIFLHIWKGDGNGTSGCTAMERREMEKLLSWLDSSANPILVQLPQTEFFQLQRIWDLPELKISTRK